MPIRPRPSERGSQAERLPGYGGWQWYAVLTRNSRSKVITVNELGLLPSEDSILAPAWVPWAERVRPEDAREEDAAEDIAPGANIPAETAPARDTGTPAAADESADDAADDASQDAAAGTADGAGRDASPDDAVER